MTAFVSSTPVRLLSDKNSRGPSRFYSVSCAMRPLFDINVVAALTEQSEVAGQ